MNLSSLSKSSLFGLLLLAAILYQAVILFSWIGVPPKDLIYLTGIEVLILLTSIFYSMKEAKQLSDNLQKSADLENQVSNLTQQAAELTQKVADAEKIATDAAKFITEATNVCMEIRAGDFEKRIINLFEKKEIKEAADAINAAIDISDAFVRESALAMQAASEGKYYRKIRPEGMQGDFLKSLTGINSAIDLLEEKEAADTRNKEMIALAMKEIKNVVDSAMEGNLEPRINSEQFTDSYKDLTERMNSLMDTIVGPINNSISALQTLARGDLTQRIEEDYQGTFGDMKTALNNTIDQLKQMVGQIKETAESVNSAANEISSGSQDLSNRTEAQASTLEETAASMEEITGAVKQNTENAREANNLSSNTKKVARDGGEVVKEAITAMGEIQNASKKIADIIGVIDEIAFQTNLLALNASVEAARAGDAGKGFAVVAGEVRSLAGRSANASKEIKDLINASVEKVKVGSDLVEQSGTSLEGIVSSVENVATLVSGITEASEEQLSGIEEINTAVAQMDEATQQNAALVEESTAAAQSMAEQANTLIKLMEFFVVSEDDDNYEKVTSRAIKNSANDAKKKSSNVAKAPVNTHKYEEGWEEF